MEESETEARPEGIENDMGASNFASEAKPSFVIQSKNPSSEKCYYEILGLQQNAASEDIKKSFKLLSMKLHPDRRFKQKRGDADMSETSETQFNRVAEAYRVLIDPLQRSLYDCDKLLLNNDTSHSQRDKAKKIFEIRKEEEAKRSLSLMEETVRIKREEEEKRGGLLINRASYGLHYIRYGRRWKTVRARGGKKFRTIELRRIEAVPVPHKVLDATMQLQCMVEDSGLRLQEGSKAFNVEGFYDPTGQYDDDGARGRMNDRNHARDSMFDNKSSFDIIHPATGEQQKIAEKVLLVEYSFRGLNHSTIVGDCEKLNIPMRGHLLDPTTRPEVERQDGVAADLDVSKTESKRYARRLVEQRRRRWGIGLLLSLGPVLAGSAFIYLRPESTWSSLVRREILMPLQQHINTLRCASQQLLHYVVAFAKLRSARVSSISQPGQAPSAATSESPRSFSLGSIEMTAAKVDSSAHVGVLPSLGLAQAFRSDVHFTSDIL